MQNVNLRLRSTLVIMDTDENANTYSELGLRRRQYSILSLSLLTQRHAENTKEASGTINYDGWVYLFVSKLTGFLINCSNYPKI